MELYDAQQFLTYSFANPPLGLQAVDAQPEEVREWILDDVQAENESLWNSNIP